MRTFFLVLAWFAAGILNLRANTETVPRPGYELFARLTEDLRDSLPKKHRTAIAPRPLLVTNSVPILRLGLEPGQTAVKRVVVSTGFIELLDFVSYAKAISEWQPDFFARGKARLAAASGRTVVPVLELPQDDRLNRIETINSRLNWFNQLAASTIALQLAPQELGYFSKAQPPDKQGWLPALPRALSAAQWEKAVLAAADHVLQCGLTVDGFGLLLETFGEPQPALPWAADLIHPEANRSKLRTRLSRLQKQADGF